MTRQPHTAPAAPGGIRRLPRPRGRTRIITPLIVFVAALAAALGLGSGPVAAATASTLVNFTASGAQQQRFDTDGNALDAHDGMMADFNGTYYLYGTSYDCGYRWGVNSTFCGFKVYSSPDLSHWTDRGFVVPAYSCADCFRPHVVYDSATKQYVLWTNDSSASGDFRVYTAPTPTGPFTQQAEPTLAFSNCGWDFGLYTDTDGTAYMVDTDCAAANASGLIVQQLTANDLTSDGQYTQIPFPGPAEAPSMFKRGSTYYITMSYPTCGYCTSTGTGYLTASSPLGPWTGAAGSTGASAWSVQNGELYANGGGPVTAKTGSTWTDYTESFSTTPLETGTNGGVAVTYAQSGWLARADNYGNGYGFLLSNYPYTSANAPGYIAFVKFANDQAVSVDPVALPFAVTAGTSYQVSTTVSGDTYSVAVNGTTVASFSDSSYTSGTIGFREYGTESAYFSDVSVTDPSGSSLFSDDFGGTLSQWNVPEAVTTPAIVNTTSCGGQPSFVSELPQAGGGDVYLYGSDLWDAQKNEGLANFFWTPLQFSTSGAIDQIPCSASATVALSDGHPGKQNPVPNIDQSSGVDGFQTTCPITGSADEVMQTFTAGATGTLRDVDLTAFQETTPTGLTGGATTNGTPVDAPLTVQLATLTASGGIGQVLSTQTFATSDVGWAPENLVFAPDIEVTRGQTYAVIASSSLTGGCYGFAENTANPYPGGHMAVSTDSGSTFTASTSTDLKFYTTVLN
ncbi:MAG TPA: family 43 glycosylhydrolase [Actinocrinis sp.]